MIFIKNGFAFTPRYPLLPSSAAVWGRWVARLEWGTEYYYYPFCHYLHFNINSAILARKDWSYPYLSQLPLRVLQNLAAQRGVVHTMQSMDTPTTQTWGVLLSEHQRHKLVKNSLSDFGVQYFLPIIEDTSIISGRHVRRMRPLLGRYVFFIIDEFWKDLSQLRGVAGLMLNIEKDYPAVVDDGALDAIRTMCVGDVYCPRVDAKHEFFYGQRVTTETGPLAYRVGRYDGGASRRREAAMFDLFGREQRICFKAGELIAA